MGSLMQLIPQVFFDFYARYVPGLVLVGAWILLPGDAAWSSLLTKVLGGKLDADNAFPAAAAALIFVPFVAGYVIAPLAKAVQRGNEHGWWHPPRPSRDRHAAPGVRAALRPRYSWVLEDQGAGKGYDWLRANDPPSGALVAKIRAEFTMHNALAVAFAGAAIMAFCAGRPWWAAGAAVAAPLMACRGASTEGTFHKSTRKLCAARRWRDLPTHPTPSLVWVVPPDPRQGAPDWSTGYATLWKDGKGWLKVGTSTEPRGSEDTDLVWLPDGAREAIRDWVDRVREGRPSRERRKARVTVMRTLRRAPGVVEYRLARWPQRRWPVDPETAQGRPEGDGEPATAGP
ncbi:hypothetical protein [Demequina iriomotensis]|uniref:hypothetical protein n=1 Tax=Demequina iriomotensis TaxID=1536641 RepID=UPI000781748C|nr:hypothetical protein [Demequina iriomotensis]